MARDRQRSKQRQAERRARRLEQQGAPSAGTAPDPWRRSRRRSRARRGRPPAGGGSRRPPSRARAPPEDAGPIRLALEQDARSLDPERPAGSPSTTTSAARSPRRRRSTRSRTGRSPTTTPATSPRTTWSTAQAPAGEGESGYAVKGRRGRDDHEAHRDRPRVVQFLIAVWAELQRVQWPNRQAMVTLTGVVLGFVLIAGGYLGLLDAIFSELIQAIL